MARLRRWVPGLVAASLVLLLTGGVMGCGGGGDEQSSTQTTAVAPVSAKVAAPVATAAAGAEVTRAAVGVTLTATDEMPEDVKAALKDHRPIVVMFYVPTGADDGVVLSGLDNLKGQYTDVFIVTYDYSKPGAYGDLAQQLKVNYPPQAMFIDTKGVVRSMTSGYADEGTLNQHVVNIRQS